MLQSKTSSGFTETVIEKRDTTSEIEHKTVRYAGRTLDLTLFAVTRALDVLVGEWWSQRKARRMAAASWSKVCLSAPTSAGWY